MSAVRRLDELGHRAERPQPAPPVAGRRVPGPDGPRQPTPRRRRRPAADAPSGGMRMSAADRAARRPRASALASSRDALVIARRNLLTIIAHAAAARVLDDPAGHVRAALPLRLRRRDQRAGRRATRATCCPGSSCRRSCSAARRRRSRSPTTSRAASSTASARCRWRAPRCSPAAPRPTPCATCS